ncbi:MAG: GNAT family N-acetyltransferase [Verrucomicrobiae bacterium]|nr:GNAT family N-acetyltransferase [Verrucomicrobiae bacterium]
MKPIPTLQTPRLTLRLLTREDAVRVRELASDPDVAHTTLNVPHPYPEGAAEQWIENHLTVYDAESCHATWGLCLADTGLLIGVMGIGGDGHNRKGEVGYWIGQAYWGRGFCTEALREVIRFAFQEVGWNKVTSRHFARNPASGRVMEKAGMTREGILRKEVLKNDRFEDIVVYGMLRDDATPS